MRYALALILLLTVATTVAQDDPFLTGDALAAEIAKSCTEGCVTFSHEQSAAFEQQLNAMIHRREQAAFEAGQRSQKASCASLI